MMNSKTRGTGGALLFEFQTATKLNRKGRKEFAKIRNALRSAGEGSFSACQSDPEFHLRPAPVVIDRLAF